LPSSQERGCKQKSLKLFYCSLGSTKTRTFFSTDLECKITCFRIGFTDSVETPRSRTTKVQTLSTECQKQLILTRLHLQTPMLVRELRNQVPTDLKFLVVLLEFACIWWCATCWFRTERSLWPSNSSTLCYRILPQRKQMELKSQVSKYHKVPKLVLLCAFPHTSRPRTLELRHWTLESRNCKPYKP
jgi:hypothetical protein